MSINWQEVVTTFLTTVGGGGVILAAGAWLIQKVLDNKLTRDTEAFKARLKADADIEIEKLRHNFQKIALEHQVKFSKLHERRAELIVDLYGRLAKLHSHGASFMHQKGSLEDKRDAYYGIVREVLELRSFLEADRIYLPESICDSLLDFTYSIARYGAVDLLTNVESEYPPQPSELDKEYQEYVEQALIGFETSIPEHRRALEKEFRAILGVE